MSTTYEEHERKIASYMERYHVNRRTAEHMLTAEMGGDVWVDGEPDNSDGEHIPLNLLWANTPEQSVRRSVVQQPKPKRAATFISPRPRHLGIVALRTRVAASRRLSSVAASLRRTQNENHR